MAQVRATAYIIEVVAAISVCLSLLLPWHQEYGTGLKVLAQALNVLIPFGLDPFDPNYIPVSQWWLVWIIPMVGIVLGLRGAVSLLYINAAPEHNRFVLGFILLWMGIVFAWFGLTYERDVQIGYWLCGVSTFVQIITVLIEMW